LFRKCCYALCLRLVLISTVNNVQGCSTEPELQISLFRCYNNKSTIWRRSDSWYQFHFDVFLGPEYQIDDQDYGLWSINRFQFKVGQDGAERSFQLQHGEPLPDTVPGSCAERQIGKRMSLATVLREEPVGIKSFWIGIDFGIVVDVVDVYAGDCLFWEQVPRVGDDILA
jgi:hypothetical protein